MHDILHKAVRLMETMGAEFCDARSQTVKSIGIQSVNGDIRHLSDKTMSGVCLRARISGRWGYYTSSSFDEDDIGNASSEAVRNASGTPVQSSELNVRSIRTTAVQNVKIHPRDVDMKEKVNAVLDIDSSQTADMVLNRIGSYSEEVSRSIIVNSAGSEIDWEEVRTRLRAVSVASDGRRMERYYNGPDGTCGFELVRSADIESLGRSTAEEAVRMLSAKRAPSGPMTVISDPMISGLLAHEVIGHASEADEVAKRRSFLTDAVGKRVASDVISMYDDGTVKGAHGTILYDDEGTPASCTEIIRDGVYRGYMHTLESASRMNAEPTGNGRAENFGKRIWARMTNTFFGPGDRTLDDLVADTKYGILCDKMINGMEDPAGGGFEAKVLRGFLIENGKITDMLQSFTLTGRALEILMTADAATKEVIFDGGMCGKGIEDWVNVSSGGPYCRSNIIVGGGLYGSS
ncbi:MAG: TldD/PmbA family protein [Methanomassiliicoccaceae archaeon]|nr:TldD/PmbA family protein [Methanomassiliicoccaceae archaeon]